MTHYSTLCMRLRHLALVHCLLQSTMCLQCWDLRRTHRHKHTWPVHSTPKSSKINNDLKWNTTPHHNLLRSRGCVIRNGSHTKPLLCLLTSIDCSKLPRAENLVWKYLVEQTNILRWGRHRSKVKQHITTADSNHDHTKWFEYISLATSNQGKSEWGGGSSRCTLDCAYIQASHAMCNGV